MKASPDFLTTISDAKIKKPFINSYDTIDDCSKLFATMEKLLFVFLLAVSSALSEDVTPVNECEGTPPTHFNSVTVRTSKGICTSLPCDFIRGESVNARIIFDSPSPAETLTAKCLATALGVTVDYPIPGKGCDSLNNTFCPVGEDENVVYDLNMPVYSIYPKVSLGLVFFLINELNETLTCFTMDANVVDKS